MADKVNPNQQQALLKQVGKAVAPTVDGAINGAKVVFAAAKTMGLQSKLGELLGEREKIREEFSQDNTPETKPSSPQSKEMNQALSNQDQAKQGSAFLNSINQSNAEKSLAAQIDSTKGKIADVKSEVGQTTLSSELGASTNSSSPLAQPNNTAAPIKEAPVEKPTAPSMPENMIQVGPSKADPSNSELTGGLLQNGGKMLESQDPTHIAQFKGEANTNEDAAANGNCGAACLAGLARATGVRSGDAASANKDIEAASKAMGRNSEYEGSSIGSFVKGAEGLGMKAEAKSGIGLDDIKKELKNGNHVALATDPSKYTGYTKKGGHLARVTDYDEKTNSFTLNDSLYQKPIQVPADKLEDAMKSGLLRDSKNTMVVIQGNKSEAGLGGKVAEQPKVAEPPKAKEEKPNSLTDLDTPKFKDWTMNGKGEFVKKDKPAAVINGSAGKDGDKSLTQSSTKVDIETPSDKIEEKKEASTGFYIPGDPAHDEKESTTTSSPKVAKAEEKLPKSVVDFSVVGGPFEGKQKEYKLTPDGIVKKPEVSAE